MIAIDKKLVERELCLESFYDFFLRFWSHISHEKLVDNWHIKFLCDELQKVAERLFRREAKQYDLVVNIPPSTTKSSICSVAFPAWLHARDATLRVICGSHGYDLSLELSVFYRRIVTSEKYKELFPEVVLVTEGKELLETSKGGYRLAASVGSGNVTGKHGHIHIFDDLIDAKAALSEVSLKAAKDWVMQVMPSRVVNAALAPVILLMQRLAIGDPTDVMLERSKTGGTSCRFICLPAEKDKSVRPRSLRKFYKNGLLDPVRLSAGVLAVKKAELGQYAFAGQYSQLPVMPGGGMFRINMIHIEDKAPTHFVKKVRYWDKAGTEKGGAYTVGVEMGKTQTDKVKKYWILDVVRDQWEAAERERHIKQTAQMDGRNVIIGVEQEPGSGGKESAQATVRNLAGFAVRVNRPVGNKVARADAFATAVNNGDVYMVRAPWNGPYLQELALFWYGPFKDQCLVAGTLIRTSIGDVPIENIKSGDLVLTRRGVRPVVWAGITGITDKLIEMRIDGVTLVSTPEHLVWTQGRGYIQMQELRSNDEFLHLENLCQQNINMRQSYLTALNITDACQMEDIFGGRGVRKVCIAPFGNTTTDQFPSVPNETFTTLIKIRLITLLRIWSVLRYYSTGGGTDLLRRKCGSIWMRFAERLQRGTVLKPGVFGTVNTARLHGMGGGLEGVSVCNVAGGLNQGEQLNQDFAQTQTVRTSTGKFINLENQAIQKSVGSVDEVLWQSEKPNNFALTPVQVKRLVPVYNLKVEGESEYFANGILVHNCDASAGAFLMLVSGFQTGGLDMVKSTKG